MFYCGLVLGCFIMVVGFICLVVVFDCCYDALLVVFGLRLVLGGGCYGGFLID